MGGILKELIERYFETPEKKAKLYLLITFAQIWAVIAMIIGIGILIFYVMKNLGILGVMI
ncbi:MAG: hypothetical protein ACLFVL_03910 [Candidatus Aenigmatarchaeota archaeon]